MFNLPFVVASKEQAYILIMSRVVIMLIDYDMH